jgi:hypothetical protein
LALSSDLCPHELLCVINWCYGTAMNHLPQVSGHGACDQGGGGSSSHPPTNNNCCSTVNHGNSAVSSPPHGLAHHATVSSLLQFSNTGACLSASNGALETMDCTQHREMAGLISPQHLQSTSCSCGMATTAAHSTHQAISGSWQPGSHPTCAYTIPATSGYPHSCGSHSSGRRTRRRGSSSNADPTNPTPHTGANAPPAQWLFP